MGMIMKERNRIRMMPMEECMACRNDDEGKEKTTD